MTPSTTMIQLFSEQYSAVDVTTVYEFEDQFVIDLDPTKQTVIREIRAEGWGGVIANSAGGVVPLESASTPYAYVQLINARGDEDGPIFYAPSSVPSPAFAGAEGAILGISLPSFTSSGGVNYAVSRVVGAHAYIQQIT